MALLCFVKFWAENPVSVYVMRKSYNKTPFLYDLYSFAKFSQVSSSFVMKMLLELELMVFLKKGGKCRKFLEQSTSC